MSTVAKYQGLNVRVPHGGRSLTTQHKNAIHRAEQTRGAFRKGEACTVVIFRGSKAVQRCEGRTLATGAKRRWNQMKGKKVCRVRGGKNDGKFKKCR